MQSRTRALLPSTEGAVMAEGVIVLPFFILILACVLHTHKSYTAKLERSELARSCAWSYSLAGCKNTSDLKLPAGCKFDRLTDGADALTGLGQQAGIGATAKEAFGQSDGNGAVADGLAGTNRLGLALLGLREGVRVRSAEDVDVPSLLGGGTRSVSAEYSVMCNEVKMKPFDIAKAAYCALGTTKPMPGC